MDAWLLTVSPIFEDVVATIPSHEAMLLTLGAAWDLYEHEDADLGTRLDLIRARLEKAVRELACQLDMARFQ